MITNKQIFFLLIQVSLTAQLSLLAAAASGQNAITPIQRAPVGLVSKTSLKEPVSIPGLPNFYGHTKFLGGMLMSQRGAPGRSIYNYQMKFLAQEGAQAVMEYYKKLLSSGGWTISKDEANAITAKRDTGLCIISVQNAEFADEPSMNSMYSIIYQQM